ncbi:MAG TPA: NUDIX domain-containing protein [Candidatus Saccharimonadales bacterium]|nr:NUDIX domain-containing protein [Candidatus Saccharimonadales bacterium]
MRDHFRLKTAVFLVLEQGGKILLLRRANTGHRDGQYGLVAGHVDGGEPVTQAMIREASEEAGITIAPADLEVVHVMHRHSEVASTNADEYVDFYFKATRYSGELRNMEPEKCDDLSWFPASNLPENTIDYVRHALECIEQGVTFSEYGWE